MFRKDPCPWCIGRQFEEEDGQRAGPDKGPQEGVQDRATAQHGMLDLGEEEAEQVEQEEEEGADEEVAIAGGHDYRCRNTTSGGHGEAANGKTNIRQHQHIAGAGAATCRRQLLLLILPSSSSGFITHHSLTRLSLSLSFPL